MYEDVENKLKKKNKILFSRDSICLQELMRLIQKQNHKTLILWAFECVKIPLSIFEANYPKETRPRVAFEICQKWACGEEKMPVAKKAILDCHHVAKEISDEYCIALCHAIGQGLSTVHVETHAIGLAFYELTSLVLKEKENYEHRLDEKIQYYMDTLSYFQNNINIANYQWADFLQKDALNKEKLLWKNKVSI